MNLSTRLSKSVYGAVLAFGCSGAVGGGRGASGCGGQICTSGWLRTQAQSSRRGLCHRITTLFGSAGLAMMRLVVFEQRSGCCQLVRGHFLVCICLGMGCVHAVCARTRELVFSFGVPCAGCTSCSLPAEVHVSEFDMVEFPYCAGYST